MLIFVTGIAYFLVYFLFFEQIGMVIIMVSLLPIIVTGFFYGSKGGLLSGVVMFIMNLVLIYYARSNINPERVIITDVIISGHVIILIGGLVGYLSDLRKLLSIELNKRKQTENELEQQKSQISEILDKMPDIICRFDSSLRIRYVNNAVSQFFQRPENQFESTSVLDLFPEKERAYIRNYLEQFPEKEFEEQQNLIVLPLYDRQGLKHYFQWSVRKIDDNHSNEIFFQTVGRNISEQYKLKTSERESLVIAESLKAIASILNSSLDIEDVLNRILKNISRVVPHDAANIMLVEENHAKMVQLVGYEKFIQQLDEFKGIKFPLSLSNLAQMASDHQALIIHDIDLFPGWVRLEQNKWINSYLGAPLIFNNELIGFLNLDSTRKDFFNEKHAIWLQAFADQAVIAIKNAKYYEEANSRAFQLTQLNEIMRVSINARKVEDIIASASVICQDTFHSHSTLLFLWDEIRDKFIYSPHATEPQDENITNHTSLHIDQNLALEIIQNNEIYYSNEMTENRQVSLESLSNKSSNSYLIIPLSIDHRPIGVMRCLFDQIQKFTTQEKNLLQQFAYQISMAISKIQLQNLESVRSNELAHTNQLLEIFSQASNLIDMQLELPELFLMLGNKLRMHKINCTIILLNENGHFQVAYHSLTDHNQNEPGWIGPAFRNHIQSYVNINTNLRDMILQHETIFFPEVNGILDGIREFANAEELDAFSKLLEILQKDHGFILPLENNEKVIGAIALFGENFNSADLPSVSLFADQIANAIEKSKLYLQISQLAITDPLTGFYNRRGLEELGKHEIERSIRFSNNLSALMIDLDFFKHINDQFGHITGDQILVQIADRFRSNLRDADIICRFGGEEFFILLPEANLKEATIIAERLRIAIGNAAFTTNSGPINATISVGICQLSDLIDNLNEMIRFADQGLYLAKESGRNCVRIFIGHQT